MITKIYEFIIEYSTQLQALNKQCMYNEWTTSLCNKWYTPCTQGSTMNACMKLVPSMGLRPVPGWKRNWFCHLGFSVFGMLIPWCMMYTTIISQTIHSGEGGRLYSINFVTSLQHGPSCTPGFDVLRHKDIIFCTVTPGRVIHRKRYGPGVFSVAFIYANTAIARRSIEGKKKQKMLD